MKLDGAFEQNKAFKAFKDERSEIYSFSERMFLRVEVCIAGRWSEMIKNES